MATVIRSPLFNETASRSKALTTKVAPDSLDLAALSAFPSSLRIAATSAASGGAVARPGDTPAHAMSPKRLVADRV
jgi:hypothetical protein